MGKAFKSQKIPKAGGIKKSKVKDIQSTSKDRRNRRLPGQVGFIVVQICQLLLALGAFNKLPVLAASDVLCLYLFTKQLLEHGWNWNAVAVAFLVAHHIRDPKILKAGHVREIRMVQY